MVDKESTNKKSEKDISGKDSTNKKPTINIDDILSKLLSSRK